MQNKKTGFLLKSFAGWLFFRKNIMAGILLFFGIFALVYVLYSVSWGAFAYAALLCSVLCFIAAALDFYRFYTKHTAFSSAAGKYPLPALPLHTNMLERDIEKIITQLETHSNQLKTAQAHQNRQNEDYYTLWIHQIKTPISAMRLLLQSQSAAQIPASMLKKLEQEIFNIEQYAAMALQYQRIHSPNHDLDLKSYPIEALVKTAVKNMASLFILKGLSFTLEPLADSFVTDEKWFVFMLEQLLSNAAKYTNTGGVRVYSPAKNVLCVQDTGIGIRPQDLPLIFQRGYTGKNGHASSFSTGLGLYLCRQIADLLGLELTASSHMGKGTTIHITILHRPLLSDSHCLSID